MDSYFPVVARTKLKQKSSQVASTSKSPKLAGSPQSVAEVCLAQEDLPCSSDITDRLLRTLSDPMNPITHSNVADRTDHYVTSSTGHQVAEGRINQGSYMASREDKLRVQHDEIPKSRYEGNNNNILKGTRIYVNGYLESTTDLEVKKIIIQLGGQLVNMASRCTHIITSRGLNCSKTHKILTKKSKHRVPHVVKPEWIFDSLGSGKRLPERLYAIQIHRVAKTIST